MENDTINVYKCHAINIAGVLSDNSQLKECCKLTNFEPEKDKALNVKIQKNYWFIFLRSMRKEKKEGGN